MTFTKTASHRRTFLQTAVAVALSAGLWATASAQQVEVKFGHVGAPGSLFAQSADLFAQRANAKLGDNAKVVVYGSSQLGSDAELLKKLKLGTVDLALPSTVMTSAPANLACSRCRIWSRTGNTRRESPTSVPHHAGADRRQAGLRRSSPSGRTATATSPTTSGRS